LIVCVITIPQTTVNYDMTKYLPDHSLTKQGLKILASEFGKESSIQVLVMDIEVNHLVELKQAILEVENIRSVIWLDDYVDVSSVPIFAIDSSILQEFYQEGDALLTIVFSQDGYDVTLEERIRQIEFILEGYTIHLRGEVINNITSRNIASQEIIKIIFLILPVIIGLLILSGHSWIEPLLVLITLGIAVVFNVVTNGLYSQISFITQTMSLALQLALSIDYALFLIHRFYDERESKDAVEASKSALKHSFKPITISALTTIAGFGALAIMNFSIGMDIALVLGKGILFSYLSTILVLPVLLVVMDKWIIATKHRRFFPSFGFIAKIQRTIALPL
ncbi:MAG: MMPL family transporter, partial [Candidatus Izemoplasmatales bacterium]|nr:MMPL family transporter [Candidatus Izemoplasmatales bacterium]